MFSRETTESPLLSRHSCRFWREKGAGASPRSPERQPFDLDPNGKKSRKSARKRKNAERLSAFEANSNWHFLAENPKAPRSSIIRPRARFRARENTLSGVKIHYVGQCLSRNPPVNCSPDLLSRRLLCS